MIKIGVYETDLSLSHLLQTRIIDVLFTPFDQPPPPLFPLRNVCEAKTETREVAYRVKALAVKPEKLSSILRTQMLEREYQLLEVVL